MSPFLSAHLPALSRGPGSAGVAAADGQGCVAGLHRGLHPDGPGAAARALHASLHGRRRQRALHLEPQHHLRLLQGQDALPGADPACCLHHSTLQPAAGGPGFPHPRFHR